MVVSTELSKDCKNVRNYNEYARERNGGTEVKISLVQGLEDRAMRNRRKMLYYMPESTTRKHRETSFCLMLLKLKTGGALRRNNLYLM